jgi:uncharacterized protein with HEPN domain
MPAETRDVAYLWDIVHAARKTIESVATMTFDTYLENEDLRLTVERRIEIIGEAARRISPGFRERHPDVPWKALIGLRNVVAHQYDQIDHERVWKVLKEQLPKIVETLSPLIPAPPEDEV